MYVGSSFLSVSIFVDDESQVKNVNRQLSEMSTAALKPAAIRDFNMVRVNT